MYYKPGIGYVESDGKKVMSKREMALRLAFVYGAENDLDSYTRLVIESRVNRQLLNEKFRLGANSKFATQP